MQPNGQLPQPQQPQAPQANPYDYLLNPAGGTPKKPFLFGSGKPNKLIKVVFVAVVLVVVMIAYSIFSSLTSKNYNDVVALAEQQQEIVRIADIGLDNASDAAVLIYISTIRNTTLSEQNATLAFLKKKDIKVTTKQLVLKKDTTIDSALKTAQQENNYNTVILTKLNGLVVDYQKAVRAIGDTSASVSETALIKTLKSNAKIIDAS